MKSKIEWYREVLELEPQSKVFFPLARLLMDSGEYEQAQDTLQQGLARHPEYVEARLLLAEVLAHLGREQELETLVQGVSDSMAEYPAFWEAWARYLDAAEDGRDPAMAVRFLAAWLGGQRLSWAQIIQAGLQTLLEEQGDLPPVPDALKQAAAMAKRARELETRDDLEDASEDDSEEYAGFEPGLEPDAESDDEADDEPHAAAPDHDASFQEPRASRSPAGGGMASDMEPVPAPAGKQQQAVQMPAQADKPKDKGDGGAEKSGDTMDEDEDAAEDVTEDKPPAGPVSQKSLKSFEKALSRTDFEAPDTQGPAAAIEHCEEATAPAADAAKGEYFADAEEGDEDEDEGNEETFSLRTRTMADLLAEQGDYEGALDIYRELLAMSPSGGARQELEDLVAEMRRLAGDKAGQGNGGRGRKGAAKPQKKGSKGLKGKTKLISALESLAQRLEAKAAH